MTPRAQLESFIAKYTPEIAALTRAVLRKMDARLPHAQRLVYDNYNALAIGYAASERPSDCVFSIAVFPRWVSLFFFQGRELDDPDGLLKGGGNQARHIVLAGAADLDRPGVKRLMTQALAIADPPMPRTGALTTIVKSISAKQRPRRPASSAVRQGATRKPASRRRP